MTAGAQVTVLHLGVWGPVICGGLVGVGGVGGKEEGEGGENGRHL